MPYIGVRHVLKSAGLLKHQEQISSELGVETISDLIELREADLQQLGLQAHWPKFEAELKATLQSGAGKSKFAERRREQTRPTEALDALHSPANRPPCRHRLKIECSGRVVLVPSLRF